MFGLVPATIEALYHVLITSIECDFQVRLGDPPKKNQRKNFFEMIRLKRRQADKQNGQVLLNRIC